MPFRYVLRFLYLAQENINVIIGYSNCYVGREDNDLLDKNLTAALKMTCKQRNYIMHNIYAFSSDIMDEDMLPKLYLIDIDFLTYTDKA